MKDQLNEVANKLQELAANYEEATRPQWRTPEWEEFMERLTKDEKLGQNFEGLDPIEAVHNLYMMIQNVQGNNDWMYREMTRMQERERNRPTVVQNLDIARNGLQALNAMGMWPNAQPEFVDRPDFIEDEDQIDEGEEAE